MVTLIVEYRSAADEEQKFWVSRQNMILCFTISEVFNCKGRKVFLVMLYTVSHHLLVHLIADVSLYIQNPVLLEHTVADVSNVTYNTELLEYFLVNIGRFVQNNT
jgi:hypothetical protein